MKFDKRTTDLLYELNKDCRQSDAQIAKKLHTSKQVIRYRIQQLEKEQIITAYNAVIDYRVLGYNSIRVYFKLKDCPPDIEEALFTEIKQNELFLWTVHMEGAVDVGFYMWIKELDIFYEKWEVFISKYRPYIASQELALSAAMIHYPMKILHEEKEVEEIAIGTNKDRLQISEEELHILKILSREANKPIVQIAQEVGISAKLTAYKIRQLEKKKLILSYNAIIDEKKLGYAMYKVDFYLNSHKRLSEMYEYAKQHPNIRYVMKTVGGPDYELEMMVKDIGELRSIITAIRKRFSTVIQTWRYNRFVKTVKQVYLPIE